MSPLSLIFILSETLLALAYGFWVKGLATRFIFGTPWMLLLGLGILALTVVQEWRHRSPRLNYSYTALTSALPTSFSELMRPAVVWLSFLGLLFLVIAAARPQSESMTDKGAAEGIDIVFALDLSGSMEAADFKPNNRLFVAKEVLTEFITQRKSDRLGLVVFAGEAYTQVPLTLDYNVLINLLNDVRTGVIRDGTAIGDALGIAVNRLRDQPSKTKVIILLTDGDNNAGSLPPLEAASIAKELGIRVYTILIGKDGPVPFPQGRDLFGNMVYADVKVAINPELLQQISDQTKALAFRAEDRESLRRGLNAALDHLERSKFEELGTTSKEELYPYFLIAGLILFFTGQILRMTRFAEALS